MTAACVRTGNRWLQIAPRTNQKQKTPQGRFNIMCVCHTSLKLRVALLRVNCSAPACHPKRHRREGWLGRTRGDGGVPPFPFWEICDFPKWLQNINNVLQCKCETYLHNPCEYQIKNTPVGCFLFGWGARIRTMIKRTKISCPTIRRHPKSNTDYKYLLCFCNNNFI